MFIEISATAETVPVISNVNTISTGLVMVRGNLKYHLQIISNCAQDLLIQESNQNDNLEQMETLLITLSETKLNIE